MNFLSAGGTSTGFNVKRRRGQRLAAHNERRQFASQTRSCGCLPRRGKHCSHPGFAPLNRGPCSQPRNPSLRCKRQRGYKTKPGADARLRAGHARPLRTAVKIYAREGRGRAAARPYGWRKVRGQGCRGAASSTPRGGVKTPPYDAKDKGAAMARLRAGHARPLQTAVSGNGGSGEPPTQKWRKGRGR